MSDTLPDLAGTWDLRGTTLGPDGTALYDWEASMQVAPAPPGFSVVIETRGAKTSRSISFAEKLTRLPSGAWFLRYGYEADPQHAATADHTFFGISQLTFAADLASARGSSCNYNGRYVVANLHASRRPDS